MHSIPTLALALALAVCQFAGDGTACAAMAGGSQPAPTTSPADCRITALTNGTVDQLAGSACHTADIGSRLAQRRPGFWIAEDAGPGSGGSVADSPAVLRAADAPGPAGSPACVSYPLPVVVGGQSLQATVVACPQPDGSWRATQYTPGLPPQVYTVPAPPAAGASPNDYASQGDYQDWGPDWGGGPWFWGFAPAIVVVQRFHFFHGFNHGFRHGFGHGFSHGFAHGFAHGSAAGHGGFGGMHR
jgi:surface antigen